MAGWILALGWMADPNALSLHTFYKMRVVRAYLGASNKKRHARSHDIADPDPDDDVTLASLRNNSKMGGPYHLVNATLNLVGGPRPGDRAALGGELRPGDPRYCGALRTGFRPTERYMNGAPDTRRRGGDLGGRRQPEHGLGHSRARRWRSC